MARSGETRRLQLTIPMGSHTILAEMAQTKVYGATIAEVAEYLLIKAIDDHIANGVVDSMHIALPHPLPPTDADEDGGEVRD